MTGGTGDLLAQYRTLPAARRIAIAEHASPKLRAQLAEVERDMALRRSPGSMAAHHLTKHY